MTNLQKLTSIIQELMPEVMEDCKYCEGLGEVRESVENDEGLGEIQDLECPRCRGTGKDRNKLKPITIAIVLMALNTKEGWFISKPSGKDNMKFFTGDKKNIFKWNLAQDDLSLQSEETITNLLKIFEV